MSEVKVEKRAPYQGVPQYGITGQNEITPSKATATKWAALENAARRKKPSCTKDPNTCQLPFCDWPRCNDE